MKNFNFDNYKKILTTIISLGTMLIGTILIIYYSKGYRFYLQEDITVKQTGVLSIDSKPNRGTLYVNNIIKGQTPKTLGSIPTGIYNIKIEKEEYHTWEKKLPVVAEKSTPYYAYLFRKDPKATIEWEIKDTNEKLIENYTSENQSNIIILTEETTETTTETSTTNNTKETVEEKIYRIYSYATNRSFWDINTNPKLIYKEYLTKKPVIQVSPDGTNILIKTEQNYYLVNDQTNIKELNLNEFSQDYNIHWAHNNKYLILENKSSEILEIYSYNLSNNVIVLLLKDTNKNNIYWETYSDENLYYLNKETSEDIERDYYQIIQKSLNGEEKEILLNNIYYKNDRTDLESMLKKQNTLTFTNSPNCQVFVGEIKRFLIQRDGLGIALETTETIYWYNIKNKKYNLVTHHPNSKILEYSPDQKNFTYTSYCSDIEIDNPQNCLKVYTFEKKESDHITKLGSKKILELPSEGSKIKYKWLSNSTYISYKQEDKIKIIDIDGENKIPLISSINENMIEYLIDSKNENLYILQGNDENSLEKIISYKIH